MALTTITQERLKELAIYDPITGAFTWKVSRGGHVKAGAQFGNPDKNGYLQAGIDGRMRLLHRMAFLYMEGSIPELVDHKNRNPSDNRWENLREASALTNMFNKKVSRTSSTGLKGVLLCKKTGRFYSYIKVSGKNKFLGAFDSKDEAFEFVSLAREMIHGEFACHG
jgi:hypothetical protein